MLTATATSSSSDATRQPSAFLRFAAICGGVVFGGAALGLSAAILHPREGAVAGAVISFLLLLVLFGRQTTWVLRSLSATRVPFSPALLELWRRATLHLAVIESAERGGRKVLPRSRLPRLAVVDHPGPIVLALRGWRPSERWLVVSRDLLNRLDEEWALRSLMEGLRALDRAEVRYRTSLSAAASALCRLAPAHLLDGPEPTQWATSIPRLLLAVAVLPFYSFLSGPGFAELSTGSLPWKPGRSESSVGPLKRILRRQLRRTRGHLPAHLAPLALWHSGGARNVLSAVVEAR